jgi:hypothetical protein
MALHLKSTGIDYTDFSDSSATGSSQTSELMDDYEEGSFTPKMADTNDGDAMSHTTQDGSYTHIGRFCFVSGIVVTNSISSATGAIRMQQLPYNSGNHNRVLSAINIAYAGGWSKTSAVSVVLRVVNNSSTASLHKWESTEGTAGFTAEEWTNDGQIQFGGSFVTAA